MFRNYEWVIMSASSWIKGRPSIDTIIENNKGEGTILVIEKYNSVNSDKSTKCFILGANGHYGKVGDEVTFTTDNGMRLVGLGTCVIQNIIKINKDGIVSCKNNIGVNDKRSLYVFK